MCYVERTQPNLFQNKRMKYLIAVLLTFPLSSFSQIPFLQLSPKQVIKQKAGVTDITIEYSRPSIRGRVIFGGLVPYDKKWRTGANRNTKITFTEEVVLGKDTLDPGTYSIFTLPNKMSWDIFIYDEVGQLDVPRPWDDSKVLARASAPSFHIQRRYESLTITIENVTNNSCELAIYWEHTGVAFPIALTTEAVVSKAIEKTLSGPTHDDYFSAALYRQRSGVNPQSALDWIDQCISLRPDEYFWDHLIRAKALRSLGRESEALMAAQKSLSIAKIRNSTFGIKEATDFLGVKDR